MEWIYGTTVNYVQQYDKNYFQLILIVASGNMIELWR